MIVKLNFKQSKKKKNWFFHAFQNEENQIQIILSGCYSFIILNSMLEALWLLRLYILEIVSYTLKTTKTFYSRKFDELWS